MKYSSNTFLALASFFNGRALSSLSLSLYLHSEWLFHSVCFLCDLLGI